MPTIVNGLAPRSSFSGNFVGVFFFDLGLAGDGLGGTFAVTRRFFRDELPCERLAGIPEAVVGFFFAFIFSSLSLSP